MSRPKGSKNRPKVSPLVEDKITSAEDAYKAMVSEGLATTEEVEKIKGKVAEIVAPFNPSKLQEEFDKVFTPAEQSEYNAPPILTIQDEIGQTEKMQLPKNWSEMGKIERLKYLTANRK